MCIRMRMCVCVRVRVRERAHVRVRVHVRVHVRERVHVRVRVHVRERVHVACACCMYMCMCTSPPIAPWTRPSAADHMYCACNVQRKC